MLSGIAANVKAGHMLRSAPNVGFLIARTGRHAQQSFVRTFIESAMRGLDCHITEDQAAEVFQPLGLSQYDTSPVVEAMIAVGDATLSPDHVTLTLSPALCNTDPAPPHGETPLEIRTAVAQVLERNGCALGREEAVVAFLKEGIEPRWGLAAGRDMATTGEVTLEANGSLTLSARTCPLGR